jgi:hypothetical protein
MTDRIFESINQILPTITFFEVFINICIALLFGLMIAGIYRYTHPGFSYSTDFVTTLIIITMVTGIVIMVIGNNLARAFGLVGAMSIIRFRTALKDSRDIAFVFFGLAAGMAAGAGNHVIGMVAIPMISFIILILHWTTYGKVEQNDFLLKFWMVPGDADEPVYQSVFSIYLSEYNMANIRSARLGQFLELTFNVRLKNTQHGQVFIKELSALEGIERASIIVGEISSGTQY